MSARDEAHESVNPSAQRGGATPSEEKIAREPATEAGVNLDGGENADARTDGGPDLSSGVEPDLQDAAAAASGPDDDHKEPELTREGLLGALAGKAKEAVGELVGNEHLARAGRVQQAEINADAEAVREADRD